MTQRIHLRTGGKDTQLTVTQARVLGSRLILAANNTPTPQALTPVPRSVLAQRSAQTAQKKASKSLQFEGKSSFYLDHLRDYAKDLAKQRAHSQLSAWKRRMAGQGKSIKGTSSGKYTITGPSVTYTITVEI